MQIVTFNLRCWWGEEDGINNFRHRIGMIAKRIFEDQPDVIGFQEVGERQFEYLQRLFPEYAWMGQFRNEDFTGEGVFVAVRKETVQVLGYNTFWLSPTPYVPGSRYAEQSDCPRICNVLRLRHKKSNLIFRVFNFHLDHVGEEARVKGMQCVLDEMVRLNQIAAFPAVLLGDFNSKPDSAAISLCNGFAVYPLQDVTTGISGTFHAYGAIADTKIDYIFMTREMADKVTGVGIWDDEHAGTFLSDHYPVWAEVAAD